MPNATSNPLPAVVTIPDLPAYSSPLTGAVLFEAVQTVGGVALSVQVPLSAIMTTVQGALPTGGGTGQILNKVDPANFSTQWSNITQFVAVGFGLGTSGSATSIAIALTTPVTVPSGGTNTTTMTAWGVVFANNTSSLGATSPATTGWPLLAQGTAAAPAYGQLNLASTGLIGVLPVPSGGSNTSTLTANAVLLGAGTSTVGLTSAASTGTVLAANAGTADFTAAPVINTSVQVPLVIGGTSTTQTLTIEATSGAGTADSIVLKTGTQSTRLVVTSGGNVGIGGETNPQARVVVSNNAQTAIAVPAGTVMSIVANDAATTILTLQNFGTLGNELIGRAAGGTAGTPSVVVTSAPIAAFGARGYTGSGFSASNNAKIGMFASQQWNATSFGAYIAFEATPTGTTTRLEAMRVGAGAMIGTTGDQGTGTLIVASSAFLPTIFGGQAAASNVVIKGTSTTSPSGDTITLQVGGLTAILQKPNATTPSVVFNQNATTGTAVFGGNFSGVRVSGVDAQSAGFLANCFGAAPTNLLTRANGTAGGLATLASGDAIGSLAANGYDGAAYSGSQGLARFLANETWNITSHGTRFDIVLTPVGSTTISVSALTVYPAILTNGGATALLITPTAAFGIYVGTGVPTISAATGSIYMRNDATTNTTRMYVNNSGTGTWTAVNTVA